MLVVVPCFVCGRDVVVRFEERECAVCNRVECFAEAFPYDYAELVHRGDFGRVPVGLVSELDEDDED